MPELIGKYSHPDHVKQQYGVIEACLKRLLRDGKPESTLCPHPEQVRTVRRLIYGYGDTLFIARTGFGKSLILHSYSILTGRITIQLVPLTGLGEQQQRDIAEFPGARPCMITADSRRAEHSWLQSIQRGLYTHVLLSPEQALSKVFKGALMKPDFQARIGLVAIDECHLIHQWKNFRTQFAMLGQLRLLLREDIVWFGCTATASSAFI
ncbi:predicted protein [Histoplasma mississippiense (nom. inval.)]|uniref:predicted protein n=1 Tax=Ajellomyces capsulatus (strain NAm1 / WU24) TaxID=2059318 RepID=UPI000157D245|nr:predicted protein [Histoplasma mississippiense (nom. inval.)]EDN04857.1 predicted protein [Histoplasma mississippiense (nom. inval.)]